MNPPIQDITIRYQDGSTLQLTYEEYAVEFLRFLEELKDKAATRRRKPETSGGLG